MISLLVVIYIVFVSLGLPDSMFGAAWPVVHTDLCIPESFASFYGIITGVCAGGVSFLAGYVTDGFFCIKKERKSRRGRSFLS